MSSTAPVKLPDTSSDWNRRGVARVEAFVAAVLGGDATRDPHDAFYDPQFEGDPKLFETVNERYVPGWMPSDERGHLISWFRQALEKRSIEEVFAISENFYTDFGGHGKVFKQVQTALIFTTGEIIHADEMVNTVGPRSD